MDSFWITILIGFYVAGMVLAIRGVVQLVERRLPKRWPEGGVNLVAGGIVAGLALLVMCYLGYS